MANEYKSFYLKDLMQMIDDATLELIRAIPNDSDYGEAVCPTQIRLHGIFDMVDELKSMLNDPEVE